MIRIALALAALALTAGCGLRGDLKRDVPLWGNPPNEGPNDPRVLREQEQARQAEDARKEAERAQRRQEREAERAAAAASPTPTATPTAPAPQ